MSEPPNTDLLQHVLRETLDIGELWVTTRAANQYGSYASELVDCRLSSNRTLRLFCKYGSAYKWGDLDNHLAHGHRGGVGYECLVYRNVLANVRDGIAKFFGDAASPAGDENWLFLEYLDRATMVKHSVDWATALPQAAVWIGKFHQVHQGQSVELDSVLNRYTHSYFQGWADRTLVFLEEVVDDFPWLNRLGNCVDRWAGALLDAPQTVLHGEFYPANILVRDHALFVVDWESAALGAGEIDLAAITHGKWEAYVLRECERVYQQARWPNGAPPDFRHRLQCARLYWELRWLGNRPLRWVDEYLLQGIERVRQQAEILGLL